MQQNIKVAALFVFEDGCYANTSGIDIWPESRNALSYRGPFPIVAHPPCARWCRLAKLVESKYGIPAYKDGGVFKKALKLVRKFGGVLEHSAYSKAWEKFNLRKPKFGKWLKSKCGGWVTEVHQADYGHLAEKKTWLYFVGNEKPFNLNWKGSKGTRLVSHMAIRQKDGVDVSNKKGLSSKEAQSTPWRFALELIALANWSVQ